MRSGRVESVQSFLNVNVFAEIISKKAAPTRLGATRSGYNARSVRLSRTVDLPVLGVLDSIFLQPEENEMSEDANKPNKPAITPPRKPGIPQVSVTNSPGGDGFEIDIKITIKPGGGNSQPALGGSWATCGDSCPVCSATCGGSCPVCPTDATCGGACPADPQDVTKPQNTCTCPTVCGDTCVVACVVTTIFG